MRRMILESLVCAAVLLHVPAAAAEDAEVKPWQIYEMKLVQIQDEPGTPAAYVIGYSVFRTAKALKDWLANIPRGNVLRWDHGSDLPLADDPLGGREGYEDLKKFCDERGIKLEIVPRP